jgi:hypothetical protein
MFTVHFAFALAIARTLGGAAKSNEMISGLGQMIGRPCQLY